MTGAARTPRERPRARPEAALAVIRIAMLSGMLVLGGVIWMLHRGASAAAPPPPETLAFERFLPWAIGAAVLVILALRAASARRDAAGARRLTVVGWAVGEFAAVAGAGWYLLARDPRWYQIGVMVLVASYVVLPIRRTENR